MPLCHLCSNLDLYAISQATVSDLFRLGETTYPDHSLFSYTSRYCDLLPAENNLTPHYNSLHALSASARSCELCSMIQISINSFLKGCESRKKLGFRESSDYELLLGGRDDADGFQILGSEKGSTRHRLFYVLLGGIGFCLDDGKYKAMAFTTYQGSYSCRATKSSKTYYPRTQGSPFTSVSTST